MPSFLKKLKKRDIVPPAQEGAPGGSEAESGKTAAPVNKEEMKDAAQLSVDVFRTQTAIIIYAQIPGASVHDFSVNVDGDEDIVTIKGRRIRPDGEIFEIKGQEDIERLLEECSWGQFYRKIILPAEIDTSKTEAKMRDGVLVLLLPLKQHAEDGTRINVVRV